MIVEDERPFQELYATILEHTDYEIVRAYDGGEALVELEGKKPDLIILDLLLDMVTGDTLFFYLRNLPKYADIPIIIVSSTSKHNYKNLMEMDPGLVFLDKALVMENLATEIKTKIG